MTIFIGLINGMISAATPILLSALGGALTYYAGIFNIAMEGMMLSGAFLPYWDPIILGIGSSACFSVFWVLC